MVMQNSVAILLDRQRPGFTLEQPFYTCDDIFRLDLEKVLMPQWHYVEHVSELPNVGDYLLHEFAGESIIIVRAGDGELHAHFNVCRHRGSRVCLERKGNVKRLVCPYHAWGYDLDGTLRSARQMPEDFEPADYGLHSCFLKVVEGLIFINLGDPQRQELADLDYVSSNLLPYLAPHGVTRAKVVHREVYPTYANWKLAVENFRECYHCSPSHPEYAQVNAYVRAGDRESGGYEKTVSDWAKKNESTGRKSGFQRFPYAPQPHNAWRMPLRDGFLTLTRDGTPAGPLMGDFTAYDGAETGTFFGSLSYFYFGNDHVTTFRFTPVSATHTEVVLTWLVHEDAVAGVDYDIDHLKWMWDVTTIQDTTIINDNQKGVNSSRYSPGRYSERETGSARFVSWYVSRLNGREESELPLRVHSMF
jgi:phenylpropionate dioxygenase-like ring-hydroxylating dioxygenase large terminal subunit